MALYRKFVGILAICPLLVIVINGQLPDSVIIMQNQYGVCNSIWNPQNKTLQDRDEYLLISQAQEQQYYQTDRNCVVSIIGKLGWQWSITINTFDVEGRTDPEGNPVECYDFVKLFDAERCDNAKLLKGINYRTGLCGQIRESEVGSVVFTTCANRLTIQFKSDVRQSFNRGFTMRLRQYPWSNPTGGPDCDPSLNGIAPGVWRDGTFTEFQNTWNEQPSIPGYVPGGNDNDYNAEINGVSCYDCADCPVTPFDPERDLTSVLHNCYTCSKEWDEEYQRARRRCYSRTDYLNLILSLRDVDGPYFGCKQIQSDYGRAVNYCFCNKDKCNDSNIVFPSLSILVLALASLLVLKL